MHPEVSARSNAISSKLACPTSRCTISRRPWRHPTTINYFGTVYVGIAYSNAPQCAPDQRPFLFARQTANGVSKWKVNGGWQEGAYARTDASDRERPSRAQYICAEEPA